jgi:hypothetical protein
MRLNHNETVIKLPTVRQGPGLVLQHNETAAKLSTVREGFRVNHNETAGRIR